MTSQRNNSIAWLKGIVTSAVVTIAVPIIWYNSNGEHPVIGALLFGILALSASPVVAMAVAEVNPSPLTWTRNQWYTRLKAAGIACLLFLLLYTWPAKTIYYGFLIFLIGYVFILIISYFGIIFAIREYLNLVFPRSSIPDLVMFGLAWTGILSFDLDWFGDGEWLGSETASPENSPFNEHTHGSETSARTVDYDPEGTSSNSTSNWFTLSDDMSSPADADTNTRLEEVEGHWRDGEWIDDYVRTEADGVQENNLGDQSS